MVDTSLSLPSASVDSQRCWLQVNSTRTQAPASRPVPPESTSDFLQTLLAHLWTRRRLFAGFVWYSGNNSNLKFHLQWNHAQDYRALDRQDSDDHYGPSSASAVKTRLKQLTLGGTLAKSTSFSRKSVEHKLVVITTADYMRQGLQPLSGDEPAFRRLLEIAEPRFRLPYCMYFTDTVMPAKYRSTRAAFEKQLAAVENCLALYLISVPLN